MDKVLIKNGSTITDISNKVDNYVNSSYTTTILSTTEIYIGKMLPFNHLYFDFVTKNINTAILNVEYWDGSQFKDVANSLDDTETFKSSGFLAWTPVKNESWRYEDSENIAELEDVFYYDKYWLRLTASVDLTETEIKYIGKLFCTDEELYSEFYQFSETDWLDGFAENKADWTEQRIVASNLVTNELKSSGKIYSEGQILKREDLIGAAVQKTAEIIYNRFGAGRFEERDAAKLEATNRIIKTFPQIDTNLDATYNRNELSKTQHWTR